jgi:hypothetical protein
LEAVLHPAFDELRASGAALADGTPFPALFDFTAEEFGLVNDENTCERLVPLHARCNENWPPSAVIRRAKRYAAPSVSTAAAEEGGGRSSNSELAAAAGAGSGEGRSETETSTLTDAATASLDTVSNVVRDNK